MPPPPCRQSRNLPGHGVPSFVHCSKNDKKEILEFDEIDPHQAFAKETLLLVVTAVSLLQNEPLLTGHSPRYPAALPMEDTLQTLRILVVEDNVILQGLICEMLHALGHETAATANAETALVLLSRQGFDVLLADIELPGMSGIEMARLAHEAAPGMHIVFASAYGYLVADRCDFHFSLLHKPFNPVQLQQVIDEVRIFSS